MKYILPVLEALSTAEVDFVIVGGVAVVLHGHTRLTVDLDLVVRLDEQNTRNAVRALTAMGLRPRMPVSAEGFCDPATRAEWREKDVTVFSLVDPSNPMVAVDLFVDYPLDYDSLKSHSVVKELGLVNVQVASIEDLIEMKRDTGRVADADDVVVLQEMLDNA